MAANKIMAKTKKTVMIVAIDPGFSGCKMVVGNKKYHLGLPVIPFTILDITGQEDKYTSLTTNDIIIQKNSRVYMIGEKVKKALLTDTVMNQAKTDYENFTTNVTRFKTELFDTALEACIAWGLYNYRKEYEKDFDSAPYELENIDDGVEVRVGVALPHANINEFNEDIYKCVECRHSCSIRTGSDTVTVNFTVKKDNSKVASQTIMALLNETMNDLGQDVDDNVKDEFLPAVIIDAGYHTVGRALLTEALTIEKDGSDTKFAMANVNESASEELKKYNLIRDAATIDELYKRGRTLDGTVYNNGAREEIDVDIVELKNRMVQQNVNLMMDEFCKIYDDFTGIRKIIVAGGSGKMYYEYIVKYFEDKGMKRASSRCNLASGTLNGQSVDPVMAIASGLYKTMAAEE